MTTIGSEHLGEIIEGYRLESVLGLGSASVVYRAARVSDPDTVVAIKLLTFHDGVSVGDRASFRTRFLREARSTSKLKHEHIVPVLSYGEEDGHTYIIMPLFSGGTLADRIEGDKSQVDLSEIANYLTQLTSALDYTHEQGIVHRDIKPSNVVMDSQGQVYLADFGIARLFDTSGGLVTQVHGAALTQTGQVLGTPYYMAPEQIRGEPVGPATDIYSLGVMLFQLVTGQLPFQGDNPLAVAMQHLQEEPCRPSLLRADCTPTMDEIILKAMAKRPEERYGRAGLMTRDFGLAVQEIPVAQRPLDKTVAAGKAGGPTGVTPVSYGAVSGAPLYHDMVGSTLGSYRLEQLLTVTEMGPVFRARSDVGSAIYRLRALSAPMDSNTPAEARSAFLGRVQQLAHGVAELRHPYILSLQDYGSARGMPYLVTNSAPGPSLAERLSQTGPMDLNMVGRRLDQIAAALQYAHEHGVLHRNLTPDCVYMQGSQDLVVADFETRRMYESLGGVEQQSALSYASESFTPEQVDGKPTDTFTDVYALGVILYHMLTGHPVYTGATRDELAQQHLHAPTPLLRRWRAGLPAGLENVVARALAKDPAQRYRHPMELAHAYHELIDSATVPSEPPAAASGPAIAAVAGMGAAVINEQTEVAKALSASPVASVDAAAAAANAQPPGSDPLEPTQVAQPWLVPPAPAKTSLQEQAGTALVGASAPTPAASAVNLSAITGSLRVWGKQAPARVRQLGSSNRGRGIAVLLILTLALGGLAAYAAFGGRDGKARTSAPGAVVVSDPDIAFLDSGGDENGANDKLVLRTTSLPKLASSHQYAAWVLDSGNERITPLGALTLQDGVWQLTYNGDGKNGALGNLLNAAYKFQITDEKSVGALPGGPVVAEAKFSTESFGHVQHLLVSFGNTPNHVGILVGMAKQIHILLDQVEAIKTYQERNFPLSVKCEAQSVIDIIEGTHGADYRPLGNDCTQRNITQIGDGFGLLGTAGYLKDAADHAQFASQAKDATPFAQHHAGHVVVASQNIDGWLSTVDQDALQILKNGDTGKLDEMIKLAKRAIAGQDVDGDESVDPIKDEAGLDIAYVHAQRLAGLTLTPVSH